ncbi:MAG: carbohydrate ABC transporter permease, partial [Nitrospinota bacterium]
AKALEKSSRRPGRLLSWITGILICVVVANSLFPYIWMLIGSVKPDNIMYATPPVWFFTPITDHYWDAFVEKGFGANFLNSVIVSVSTTLLVIVIGTPAAYSFGRFPIKRSDDFFMYILSTRMAPAISLAIPFYLMFAGFGLLNTYIGLILAHLTFNLSFYIWILRGFFKDIPVELEESSMVDGYTRWQAFTRVTLPLARSGIIAAGIFCFIFSWNEFLYALILGGGDVKTLPIVIPSLINQRGVEWGEIAAIGSVVIIPILVLVFVVQRHIVRGLTMGAVKG